MKHVSMCVLISIVAAALLTTAMISVALTDSDSRPFKGTVTGKVSGIVDGSLNATHMGNGTLKGRIDVKRTYHRPPDCKTGKYIQVSAKGDLALIAANGDVIKTRVDKYARLCTENRGKTVVTTVILIAKGGSGRFADASGQIECVYEDHGGKHRATRASLDGTLGY